MPGAHWLLPALINAISYIKFSTFSKWSLIAFTFFPMPWGKRFMPEIPWWIEWMADKQNKTKSTFCLPEALTAWRMISPQQSPRPPTYSPNRSLKSSLSIFSLFGWSIPASISEMRGKRLFWWRKLKVKASTNSSTALVKEPPCFVWILLVIIKIEFVSWKNDLW